MHWLLGFPGEVYGFGIQLFMSSLILVLFVPPSMYIFMVVFYKMKLTSVFEVRWSQYIRFVRTHQVQRCLLVVPGIPIWVKIHPSVCCLHFYFTNGPVNGSVSVRSIHCLWSFFWFQTVAVCDWSWIVCFDVYFHGKIFHATWIITWRRLLWSVKCVQLNVFRVGSKLLCGRMCFNLWWLCWGCLPFCIR